MLILPTEMIVLLVMYAPEISQAVWLSAQGVLVGAILSPHKRTVTAALRAMGLNRSGVTPSLCVGLAVRVRLVRLRYRLFSALYPPLSYPKFASGVSKRLLKRHTRLSALKPNGSARP